MYNDIQLEEKKRVKKQETNYIQAMENYIIIEICAVHSYLQQISFLHVM